MPDFGAMLHSRGPRKAAPLLGSGHVRMMALALIFITAQLAIIVFAATALEGVNALRAYATGEAQWSKAQKRAVISLMHYSGSRDVRDLTEFRSAMTVIAGDSAARTALEQTPPDMETAERGFLAGLNAAPDIWGMRWGFLVLHRWAPFALAVEDWRRADGLTARLSYLAGQLRGAIESEAPLPRLRAILADISALDRSFSENEYRFSVHMGEASRSAKSLTLLVMVMVSLFVCLVVGVFVRRIARAGATSETRARENEERARDYGELAADWYCELDAGLRVAEASARLTQIAGLAAGDVIGVKWLDLKDVCGLSPLSDAHSAVLEKRLPFRGHPFEQMTGGPIFHWVVSGKPLFDDERGFAGYRIAATAAGIIGALQEGRRVRGDVLTNAPGMRSGELRSGERAA